MAQLPHTHTCRTSAGQTIYHVMLIIACVALAAAITFPVIEYFELYRTPSPKPYKFEKGPGSQPSRGVRNTSAPEKDNAPAGAPEKTNEAPEPVNDQPANAPEPGADQPSG